MRSLLRRHPHLVAVALIAGTALAVRLAFVFRAPVFLLHDSGSYFLPAHDLVYGDGFDLSIRRTPVYPWFLAGVMSLFGEELMVVAFAQHLLGVGSAVLVYALGRATFGAIAGLLAGLLTALDGTLLVAEHYVMPEALLLALLLASFVVALRAAHRDSVRWAFAAGVLLGVSALCKPVAQVLIPVIPFVWLVNRGVSRRFLLATGAFTVGFVAVALPWMGRNYFVHGSATTAGALGQTLLARTAKHDRGFRWYDADDAARYGDGQESAARQIVQSGIRQRLSDGVIYRRLQERLRLSDAEVNGYMRDLSIRVIAERPLYYLTGTAEMSWQLLVGEVEKLRTDWKTQNSRLSRDEWEERVEHLLAKPTPAHQNEFERADLIVGLHQPGAFGLALPILALVGLLIAAITPRLRPALLPPLAALSLIVVSAALDGPVARYRYPADPLIALSAMGGLVAMLTGLAGAIGRAAALRQRVAQRLLGGGAALTRAAHLFPTLSHRERG